MNSIDLVVFDAQCLEAGFLDDGAVDDCDCFFELALVAQLVVQVDAGEEHVELGVRVDPTQGQNIVLDLRFECGNLVSHLAEVGVALLPRDDEVSYQEPVLFFPPAEESTRLDLVVRIQSRIVQKLNDYVQGTSNFF